MTTINDVHVEEKITAWKKDMNMMDFFLLAKLQVPRFKELVAKLSEEKKQKEEAKKEDFEIPEN